MNRRRQRHSPKNNDRPVHIRVLAPEGPPIKQIPCVLIAVGIGEHGGEGILEMEMDGNSKNLVFPTAELTPEAHEFFQDVVNEIKRPITLVRFTVREHVETFYPEIELT